MPRRLKASDAIKRLKIPPDAEQEVFGDTGGSLSSAWYKVHGEIIALITWEEDGTIFSETPIKNGVPHGMCRHWASNGQLTWECRYVHGKEHGVIRQWHHDGRLLGLYKMVHGTGHDLWFDEYGRVSEEYYMVDGRHHGLQRWWQGKQLWYELYWKNNEPHGIERDWNYPKLSRGYPKYYISGKRVTKRQYMKATESDPSLPKFLEKDNHPRRKDRPGEAYWNPDDPSHA